MEKLLDLEKPQEYLIRRPYELVDPTPYLYRDNEGMGHSTKRANHNGHTKLRKAKRRLNKKHNK